MAETMNDPQCRECGASYGWDKVVPHAANCSHARPAGVLADDCNWITSKPRTMIHPTS